MKIKELNCLLGKINCTLNSIKSNVSQQDALTIDSLLQEIEYFQEQLPSNHEVDESIDTILFVLDDQIGNLIDDALDYISPSYANQNGSKSLSATTDSKAAPIITLDAAEPNNCEKLRTECEVVHENGNVPGSQKDFKASSLSSHSLSGFKGVDSSDLSFTVQGAFGASSASSASETKIELFVSHKYLWSAINKRLTDMAYKKIPYNSINLSVFADFLNKFYSPNKSIYSMIELFVDMGEHLKSDVYTSLKGDTIVISVFSSTTTLVKNISAFEKRYLHKSSVVEIIKEVSLLESDDNKLSAIFNF